jgi:class 3 adenylate cyclase
MLMLLMLLPVVNHVIQGGYAASGAVLCWSTITPALAGILLQSRFAVVLFTIIAVCAITFATMLAKVTAFVALDLRASEGLTGDLQTIFYFFDITLPNIALLLAVFFYDLRLSNEQHRTETLLNRIMPRKFASMLRRRKRAVVQYDNATCLFAEVVGFAELVESHSASDVIATIDILFEQMDAIAAKVGVLKVATIGHVYFAVAGVPVEVDPRESARKMANFALALRDLMSRDTEQYGIRLRMGIHSGPVVAGVIGNLSPQFTLIGDSVNVASRMESTSAAGRIHCSEATCRLLEPEFTLSRRAPISIKGKGMMQTYWLVGRLMSFEVASSPRRRSTLAHSRKGARGLRWRRRRSTQSTTASSGFEPAMEMESAETTSEEDEDDEEEEEEKE